MAVMLLVVLTCPCTPFLISQYLPFLLLWLGLSVCGFPFAFLLRPKKDLMGVAGNVFARGGGGCVYGRLGWRLFVSCATAQGYCASRQCWVHGDRAAQVAVVAQGMYSKIYDSY